MNHDVRCSKLYGRLVPNPAVPGTQVLEIKCDSRICKGWTPGAVVLHYFSLVDGQLLETKRFRNPPALLEMGNEVKSQ